MTRYELATPPAGTNGPLSLSGRFDPFAGTFGLHCPLPDRARKHVTRKSLSVPMFHALRKNFATVGGYTLQTSDFRAQIPAWFAAYDARRLVIFGAEVLPPATLAELLELTATVKTVTFVTEPDGDELTRHVLAMGGLTDIATTQWHELLEDLPVLPVPEKPQNFYTMDDLPLCDFVLFRNRARHHNTAEVFAAIDADYTTAYKRALDAPLTLEGVINVLGHAAREATSTGQIMTALRATQSALLARGWLLQAHQDMALGTLCALTPPTPTEAHWRALNGYTRTQRAAGVALYLLDIPTGELNSVTVGDVRAWLSAGAITHTDIAGTAVAIPIPLHARPCLAAHLNFRRSQSADDKAPYLDQAGPRRHLEDLIEARRDLGIPVDGRNLKRGDLRHSHRALYRLGLNLKALAA